jgi:hypothetical protein
MPPRQCLYPRPFAIGPNRHPADQIRDAEAFCRSYLDIAMRENIPYMPDAEYEDSLAMLITDLWRLAERFKADQNDCFADYARSIIRNRAIDRTVRRLLGRNGNRLNDYLHDTLDESTRGSRLQQADPLLTGDTHPDRGADDRGLQPERARNEAWAATVLGLRAPAIAA